MDITYQEYSENFAFSPIFEPRNFFVENDFFAEENQLKENSFIQNTSISDRKDWIESDKIKKGEASNSKILFGGKRKDQNDAIIKKIINGFLNYQEIQLMKMFDNKSNDKKKLKLNSKMLKSKSNFCFLNYIFSLNIKEIFFEFSDLQTVIKQEKKIKNYNDLNNFLSMSLRDNYDEFIKKEFSNFIIIHKAKDYNREKKHFENLIELNSYLDKYYSQLTWYAKNLFKYLSGVHEDAW